MDPFEAELYDRWEGGYENGQMDERDSVTTDIANGTFIIDGYTVKEMREAVEFAEKRGWIPNGR